MQTSRSKEHFTPRAEWLGRLLVGLVLLGIGCRVESRRDDETQPPNVPSPRCPCAEADVLQRPVYFWIERLRLIDGQFPDVQTMTQAVREIARLYPPAWVTREATAVVLHALVRSDQKDTGAQVALGSALLALDPNIIETSLHELAQPPAWNYVAVGDPVSELRFYVAPHVLQRLAPLVSPNAIAPSVIRMLKNRMNTAWACQVLGTIHPPNIYLAIDELFSVLEDVTQDEFTRTCAAESLGALGGGIPIVALRLGHILKSDLPGDVAAAVRTALHSIEQQQSPGDSAEEP